MCFQQSNDTIGESPIPVSPSLEEILKENNNLDTVAIRWQYVGLENGTMGIFPLNHDNAACGTFDPRNRLDFQTQ